MGGKKRILFCRPPCIITSISIMTTASTNTSRGSAESPLIRILINILVHSK